MNTIFLYKIPYVYGDLTQPYFKSVGSRDTYFSKLPKKQANHDNVNIKLSFNLELELKVNVDITEVENYNFAIVTYNDKKYYANIIDSEHISIGYSRLYLKRNLLFEIPDYLSNFKNFNVERCSVDSLTYGGNAKFYPPDEMRYVISVDDQFLRGKIYYKKDNYVDGLTVSFQPFYLLFIKSMPDDSIISLLPNYWFNGEVKQGSCICVPVKSGTYFIRHGGNGGEDAVNISFGEADFRVMFDKLSPYIISICFVYLPVFYNNSKKYVVGFGMKRTFSSIVSNLNVIEIHTNGFFDDNYDWEFSEVLYENIDYFSDEYVNVEYRIYNSFNSFSFSEQDFMNSVRFGGKVNYKTEFNYLLSTDGTVVRMRCRSGKAEGDSVFPSNHLYKSIFFPIGDTTSFTLSSEADFKAQNRYYDALTNEAIRQRVAAGALQAGENFAIGGAQIAMGSGIGMQRNMGEVAMGIGNSIRGIFEIGNTVNDYLNIENNRSLLKKQSSEKPDTYMENGNASDEFNDLNGKIIKIRKIPFPNDLNSFLKNSKIYGVDVNYFTEKIDLNEFISDGFFFLKAIAVKDGDLLNTRQYSELYRILSGGLRYEVI